VVLLSASKGGNMNDVTTTDRKTFTWAESVDLARLVFKRFGHNLSIATSAWNRLLQNNCTEGQFLTLLNDPNHTAHCEGSCIAGATDQPD